MPAKAAGVYRAYLLRLWQVESEQGPAWRAELEDVRTGEQTGFASLEALLAYLRAQGDVRAQPHGSHGDPSGDRGGGGVSGGPFSALTSEADSVIDGAATDRVNDWPNKWEVTEMARTTEQVLQDHMASLMRGDLPAIMADYAEDAVLMTLEGPLAGKAAIETFFLNGLGAMPNMRMGSAGVQVHGEFALVAWSAEFDGGAIPHGVDTFFIHDDRIHVQTVVMTVVPA